MVMSTITMLNIIHRQTIPLTGNVNWPQNQKLANYCFYSWFGFLPPAWLFLCNTITFQEYFWCSPLSWIDCKFSNAGICSPPALTFLFLFKTWRGCGQNITQEFAKNACWLTGACHLHVYMQTNGYWERYFFHSVSQAACQKKTWVFPMGVEL